MPRRKKDRGRPLKQRYPPRTDTTADELVEAFFRAGPGTAVDESREYNCTACGRGVYYPEVLYRDGRCGQCRN